MARPTTCCYRFNHEAWASRIKSLVDEILEIEKRISSVVLPDSDFHFELHDLIYEKNKTSKTIQKSDEYNLFERGYIDLPSLLAEEPASIQFDRVGGVRRKETLKIRHKTFTVVEIARFMHKALESVDRETASESDSNKCTQYATLYPENLLENVVRKSVWRAQINETRYQKRRDKFFSSRSEYYVANHPEGFLMTHQQSNLIINTRKIVRKIVAVLPS